MAVCSTEQHDTLRQSARACAMMMTHGFSKSYLEKELWYDVVMLHSLPPPPHRTAVLLCCRCIITLQRGHIAQWLRATCSRDAILVEMPQCNVSACSVM